MTQHQENGKTQVTLMERLKSVTAFQDIRDQTCRCHRPSNQACLCEANASTQTRQLYSVFLYILCLSLNMLTLCLKCVLINGTVLKVEMLLKSAGGITTGFIHGLQMAYFLRLFVALEHRPHDQRKIQCNCYLKSF